LFEIKNMKADGGNSWIRRRKIMKNIGFTDITIRECEKSNGTLSFKEKVEIAKIMDRVNYTCIELPELGDSKGQELLVKTIAGTLKKSGVSIPVGFTKKGVTRAWDCIAKAKKPTLTVAIPVSAVQMEYICRKKGAQIIEMIGELVTEAAGLSKSVEFSALDASRAEFPFVCTAIKTAIEAGANRITVCDTAGVMLPDEMKDFIEKLIEEVPELKEKELSVELSNELDMATACANAAAMGGAVNFKTTVCGGGFPAITSVVKLFDKRGEALDIEMNIVKTELQRSVSQMQRMLGHADNSAHILKTGSDDQLFFDVNDDINVIRDACAKIGYELTDEDAANVYEAFIRVAGKKEKVSNRELEAIIASSALQVPPTYKLENYVINSGNIISASANIKLIKNGEALSGISVGDGPIDASFKAIEQILGHHYELDDFQIQSVTEGREAMGQAVVKLRVNGNLYSGTGISTDIIGASVRAYINAINKIVYTEE
jgi:2-isopropylmalate synthase